MKNGMWALQVRRRLSFSVRAEIDAWLDEALDAIDEEARRE